jgi:hypothetical protein
MEFKITNKTRIKLDWTMLYSIACRIKRDVVFVSEIISLTEKELGVKKTSKAKELFYFKVEDKAKYMLAKIKHGI